MTNSQNLVSNTHPETQPETEGEVCISCMLEMERKLVLLQALLAEQGYDRSAIATQAFLDDLEAAVSEVREKYSSHVQGVSLDCMQALAWAL